MRIGNLVNLVNPILASPVSLGFLNPPFFALQRQWKLEEECHITHSVSKLTISAALNCHALWRQVKVLFMKAISVVAPQNPHFPGSPPKTNIKNSRRIQDKQDTSSSKNCNNNNNNNNNNKTKKTRFEASNRIKAWASPTGCRRFWLLLASRTCSTSWKLVKTAIKLAMKQTKR